MLILTTETISLPTVDRNRELGGEILENCLIPYDLYIVLLSITPRGSGIEYDFKRKKYKENTKKI